MILYRKYKITLLFAFVIILFAEVNSFGQNWKRYRREFSLSLGASNFLGDLGGANSIGTDGFLDFDFPSIRPAMNLGYSYKLSQRFAVKTCFTYGFLSGNDKYTDEKFRNHRNLSFRTSITQLHSQLEFYIIREKEGHKYFIQGVKGLKNLKISSYLFVGVGAFYFNPKAQYNAPVVGDGKWYALRPLHTEGESYVPTRRMYSLVQPTIPLGIGFKYALKKNISIGIEYSIYKTFTDYVDDLSTTYFDQKYLLAHGGAKAVWFADPHKPNWAGLPLATTAPGQQRGNPRNFDSYMFALVTIYYQIPSGRFVIPLF